MKIETILVSTDFKWSATMICYTHCFISRNIMQEMIKIGNAVQTGVGNGGNCTKNPFQPLQRLRRKRKNCKTLSWFIMAKPFQLRRKKQRLSLFAISSCGLGCPKFSGFLYPLFFTSREAAWSCRSVGRTKRRRRSHFCFLVIVTSVAGVFGNLLW